MPISELNLQEPRWPDRESPTKGFDKLHKKATRLTLEQQQKLCIARLLPLKPRVILMDEPCSALDAEGTQRIESLIDGLKEKFTIVIVTHNKIGRAHV